MLFLLTVLGPTTGACVAGFGATTGLVADSGGNMAVVARGWARSGPWLNKDKSDETRARWGMPIVPTAFELGVGYDMSRHGLRLECALPAIGFVRAPLDGSGEVLSAHIGARIATTVLDNLEDEYFTVGGYVSFSLSHVCSSEGGGSKRSDWETQRTYTTAGLRVEAGLGGGSEWGSVFVGPEFEQIHFYHIYLSEGPQEEISGPEPPAHP